jgi:GNAT superfamily N-acetyltransferase
MARPPEYERMLATMRAFFGLVARSSEGAHLIELEGVLGSVCPQVPNRSLPNSVVYESGEALIAALPELAARYEEAGTAAWTVWAPEGDADVAAALEAAGHRLDATPAAMTIHLAELAEPPGELDCRTGHDLVPVIAGINDRAFGLDDGPFTTFTAKHPEGVTQNYAAYLDGEPAASVMVLPENGDAGVFAVATLPEARGRGLAGGLLHRALWDARERGCDMSSLQATRMGAPVYARLGYRAHGALEMWERR